MHNKLQNSPSRMLFNSTKVTLTIAILFALAGLPGHLLHAQSYQVVYSFTDGTDGVAPWAGVAIDGAGNVYGTTKGGGSGGYGTVFKLSPTVSGWALSTLYSFTGDEDGGYPQASLTIGPNGILYGTTWLGGGTCYYPYGSTPCGLVFALRPPRSALSASWTESVIHTFTGAPDDGAGTGNGTLVIDNHSNLYGTTGYGGPNNAGTIYELTPSNSSWTETILYSAANTGQGVVADSEGNLYGVGDCDYDPAGCVYELSRVGLQWTLRDLHDFDGGDHPWDPTSVMLGADGNLYGTTFFSHSECGNPKGGSVFMLTGSQGYWTFSMLYDFASQPHGPDYGVIRDASGNLYGGDDGGGLVYRLTPAPPGEYWGYTDLHDFSGSDGINPLGNLAFDAQGNLWGTTSSGGAYGHGVVWEITFPSRQSASVKVDNPKPVPHPTESCPMGH